LRRCKETDCPAWTLSDEDHCYFHVKQRAGLFDLKPNQPRHHVLESAVVDDEQRELAGTLQILGVDDHDIRSALQRKPLRKHHWNELRGATT
jgi:hypothetical protein